MKVALFSDIHGRFRVVLHMLQCWQIRHEQFLDLALVAGDLGCFPDLGHLDRATKSWMEHDQEEAAFSRYFVRPHPDVQKMIKGEPERGPFSAVKCPILFVAGNHEDFDFLSRCAARGAAPGLPKNTFPVDCYSKFHCIQNGAVVRFKDSNEKLLRIAGLWGVENVPDGDHRKISGKAVERLISRKTEQWDLLVTHDAPAGSYPGRRSSEMIGQVLRACQPPLHLFGHTSPVDGKHEFSSDNTPTRSWIFEDVAFGKDCKGKIEGAVGILDWNVEWGAGQGKIEIVTDDWLYRMRHSNWADVWP